MALLLLGLVGLFFNDARTNSVVGMVLTTPARDPALVQEQLVPAPAPPPASDPSCKITCLPDCPMSSRPGVPCLQPPQKWPYQTNTPWRGQLGDRLLRVVTPWVTEAQCEGFTPFGDHVFCHKAMTRQDGAALALSYGIEGRDMWSEKMSNIYHVQPRLFDCFVPDWQSPIMARKVLNNTGRGGCNIDKICYEMPVETNRVCLGPEQERIQGKDYDTMRNHLKGRGPLSTYIKMDVEGSEWAVLEEMLDSEEDMSKIRTLDMEAHFGFTPASEGGWGGNGQKQLEREVHILERLLERFVVTGSTLEVYRQGWRPESSCPVGGCDEPPVHLTSGFGVSQFAVSFVNRGLIAPGMGPPLSLSLQAAPAA